MERGGHLRAAGLIYNAGHGNRKYRLCREDDYRGYGGTAGIAPMKELFAQMLHTKAENIYIGGTMSTSIMYDIVNKAWLFGLKGHEPWGKQEKVKFICPSPGYEKHFKICTIFGIEMIPVPMDENGRTWRKSQNWLLRIRRSRECGAFLYIQIRRAQYTQMR